MAEIYGSNLWMLKEGKRVSVKSFEAPANGDCDCKFVCCGTTMAIQFKHPTLGLVQIPLIQLYNYLNNLEVIDVVNPTAPSALVVSLITDEEFRLTWTASTDAGNLVGYRVYLDDVLITTVNAPTVTYLATGLNPDNEYAVKIIAFDIAGNESTPLLGTATTAP